MKGTATIEPAPPTAKKLDWHNPAVVGETLICTYLGKGKYNPDCEQPRSAYSSKTSLVLYKPYIVDYLIGHMIKLVGEPGLYYPLQFTRPAKSL